VTCAIAIWPESEDEKNQLTGQIPGNPAGYGGFPNFGRRDDHGCDKATSEYIADPDARLTLCYAESGFIDFAGSHAITDFLNPDKQPPLPLVELPDTLNLSSRTMFIDIRS
jgi:hypothetical protein